MSNLNVEAHIQNLADQFLAASNIDYVGFWQIVPQVRQIFSSKSEQEQRDITIEVAVRLIIMGLIPFNFKKNPDGSFSTVNWKDRDPVSARVRIANQWTALSADPSPGNICWFKRSYNQPA